MRPTGLVRVRVVPEDGPELDLAVPGRVPVADLLPELARRARLTAGARLVTVTGTELALSAGLSEQEVSDGAVLALVPADLGSGRLDDPAEVLARQVATEVLGWHPRLVRPVALAVGVVLLAVGGVALARGPGWSGAVAASAAVVLGGFSSLAARQLHERLMAAGSGWAAVGFAAVAGSQYAGAVAACVAAAAAALVLARVSRSVGLLLTPALAAAALLGCLALAARSAGVAPGLVAALGLTAAALLLPALPRLALGMSGGRAASARELLRAMHAASAIAMMVVAVPTAASGAAGAVLAAVVGLLAACRASRHHGAVEVLTGVVTGVVIAALAAAVTILRHPGWGGAVGLSCLVVGGAACGVALGAAARGRRAAAGGESTGGGRGDEDGSPGDGGDPRLALAVDRIEAAALLALAPLLVGVGGVVPVVTGLVGR